MQFFMHFKFFYIFFVAKEIDVNTYFKIDFSRTEKLDFNQ